MWYNNEQVKLGVMMMEQKPMFITFEGVDGCGKSTQLRFLAEYLEGLGLEVVRTREPGGSLVAEKIRSLLLDKENMEMAAETEALLYAASRREHLGKVILPGLNSGKIVLCDRYVFSSYAYQGYGRELGLEKVEEINKHAIDGILPDLTFLISLPYEEAMKRMLRDNKDLDRLESETPEFHERVWKGFELLAIEHGDRIVKIDVAPSQSKFTTADQIKNIFIERYKALEPKQYGKK